MKILSVLMLSGFLIAVVLSPTWAMGDAGFVQESLTGKSVIDFTLPTVKNAKFNLSQSISGKKAILVFWATWCPHCREALKEINLLRKEIAAKGIEVVFVSLGEDRQSVENYLARNNYDFDVVLDTDQVAGQAYQVVGVPMLLYVNERGTIKSVEYGFSNSYEDQFK